MASLARGASRLDDLECIRAAYAPLADTGEDLFAVFSFGRLLLS
jgi:hypothetical protein